MTLTIALDDVLATALQEKAKKYELSLEQLAVDILADSVDDAEGITPKEVVARIQATVPNPSAIRAATGNLADALRDAPADPLFDLDEWTREWSVVEGEIKALRQANDIAEGHAE